MITKRQAISAGVFLALAVGCAVRSPDFQSDFSILFSTWACGLFWTAGMIDRTGAA
jgi:hypothetical protein